MAIPNKMIYNNVPPSIPSETVQMNLVPSTAPTAPAGSRTHFDIPCSGSAPGHFLDGSSSYFIFKIEATAATTNKDKFDLSNNGAYGLIDRVEIYSGGHLVHSQENYSDWFHLVRSLSDAPADLAQVAHQLEGSVADRKGASLTNLTADMDGSNKKTVCIRLPHMILNSNKMIPVHMIDNLRVVIQWKQAVNALLAESDVNVTGLQYSDMEMKLNYINVDSSALGAVKSRGGDSWSTSLWDSFTEAIPAGTHDHTSRIACRKSSVKSIFTVFKHKDYAKNTADYTSRTIPCTTLSSCQYQYVFAGIKKPQKPVKFGVESLSEIVRAWHSGASALAKSDLATYQTAGDEKQASTFMIGLDCESFSGKSNSAYGGISTLQAIPELEIKLDGSASTQSTAIHCVHYDCRLSVQNGLLTLEY